MGGKIERSSAGKGSGSPLKSVEARSASGRKKRRAPGTSDEAEEEKEDVLTISALVLPKESKEVREEESAEGEERAAPAGAGPGGAEVRESRSDERGKEHDKYCHFCQHVKINMLACEAAGCTHRYCIYCLSAHLGDDTDPATSAAWTGGTWICPTCRSMCCCSYPDCARSHRHCKAFRYRCRRADAASMRATAAHALVSLAASSDSDKADAARTGKQGEQKSGGGADRKSVV